MDNYDSHHCKTCTCVPMKDPRCTLGKTIWMVLPPGGVTLPCPMHAKGHFIRGSAPRWETGGTASPYRVVTVWN
jgi:hypothetical protein